MSNDVPVPDGLPALRFSTVGEWEQWLEENAALSRGLWMQIAKRGAGAATVSHPEALEAALCFGWIDGTRRALDEIFFLQKFTPRRPRSVWSRINRDKVLELIAQGRVREAGLREVESAKRDGRWDAAYEPQSAITIPEDLQAVLAASEAARAFFEKLDSRNRYAILYRLQSAKKPETRAARLATFAQMLSDGRKIHE